MIETQNNQVGNYELQEEDAVKLIEEQDKESMKQLIEGHHYSFLEVMKSLKETHNSVQELSKAHKEQRILSAENVYQSEMDLINNWFIEGKEAIQRNMISQLRRKLDILYGEQQTRSLFQRKRLRSQVDGYDNQGRKRARKTPTSLWNAHFMRFKKNMRNNLLPIEQSIINSISSPYSHDHTNYNVIYSNSDLKTVQKPIFENKGVNGTEDEVKKNSDGINSDRNRIDITQDGLQPNPDGQEKTHKEQEVIASEKENDCGKEEKYYFLQNSNHSNIYFRVPSLSTAPQNEIKQDISIFENILSETENIVDDEEEEDEILPQITQVQPLSSQNQNSMNMNQFKSVYAIPDTEQVEGGESQLSGPYLIPQTGDIRLLHPEQFGSQSIVHLTSSHPPPPEVSPSAIPPNPNYNLISYFPQGNAVYPHQFPQLHPHSGHMYQQGQMISQQMMHNPQNTILQSGQQLHGQRGVSVAQFESSRIYPSVPPGPIYSSNLHSLAKQSSIHGSRQDGMDVHNGFQQMSTLQNGPSRISTHPTYPIPNSDSHPNIDLNIVQQPQQQHPHVQYPQGMETSQIYYPYSVSNNMHIQHSTQFEPRIMEREMSEPVTSAQSSKDTNNTNLTENGDNIEQNDDRIDPHANIIKGSNATESTTSTSPSDPITTSTSANNPVAEENIMSGHIPPKTATLPITNSALLNTNNFEKQETSNIIQNETINETPTQIISNLSNPITNLEVNTSENTTEVTNASIPSKQEDTKNVQDKSSESQSKGTSDTNPQVTNENVANSANLNHIRGLEVENT